MQRFKIDMKDIAIRYFAIGLISLSTNFGLAFPHDVSLGSKGSHLSQSSFDGSREALAAASWRWLRSVQGGNSVETKDPGSYQIKFRQDGSLSIKADCNLVLGSYTVDGRKMTIKLGPATMALCPGDSRSEEFARLLSETESFLIVGNGLILTLKSKGELVLSTPNLVDLCGDKVLIPNTKTDTLDPSVSKALDEKLRSYVQPGRLSAPGVSVLVITPKGKYFKSIGVADVGKCKELSAESPFQIGSNTKMMTSAMIYQLQEQGKLSTGDLVSKWLPEFGSRFPNFNKITIDMLLTHTSGLADYFEKDSGGGAIKDGVNNKAILTRGYAPVELIRAAETKPLFEPAEAGKWSYSNTGYIMLGMIIEKVTGKSYEQNLKTRIFRPLGLKKTYLQQAQSKAGVLPTAYYAPPFVYTTSEWDASQGWAAGAVVSTSEEFAKFIKALFTGKLFKSAKTLELMKTPPPNAGKDVQGPGTQYCHGALLNAGFWGHGGQTLGFQSLGGHKADGDVTFVVWGNSASNLLNALAVPPLANVVNR